jgi:hypothetical protein
MSDYLKAVIANKFTLAGHLLYLGAGIAGTIFPFLELNNSEETKYIVNTVATPLLIGTILEVLTDFGRDTLDAYRRTRKHIEKEGTLDPRFSKRYVSYCDKSGERLAAREAGLEDLVQYNSYYQ